MSALFLDTSGWFASMVQAEPKYAAARQRLAAAAHAGSRLVTTSLVVAEMHALLLRRGGIDIAMHFIENAIDAATPQVVYPDEEIVRAARTRWLRRYADQWFSLCDAASFEIMRRERITEALATDRHFATAGFEILR